MFDFERLLKVRNVRSMSFGPDGTLAFVLDITDVPQVWTLTEPCGWPTQRTFGDDSVRSVSWSPTRREFAFGRDPGGRGRRQLFRLSLASGEVTPLTDDPATHHRWGGWSHDGDRFAFAANARQTSSFDVFVGHRGEGDTRRVAECDTSLKVCGWGPDDERLVVTRSRSVFDQDIGIVDVADERVVYRPSHSESHISNVQWGPDGEFLYLVTDYDSDRRYAARLNPDEDGPVETGLQVVEADDDWNVGGLSVDATTGRVTLTKNVDGEAVLCVGTLADGVLTDVEEVPFPGSVVVDVSIPPHEDEIAVLPSGRQHNMNVTTVDLTDGSTTKWTDASTAGLSTADFVAPETHRYESFDGTAIPTLFSTPDSAAEQRPAIVDLHGGPESQRRPAFNVLPQYFLSRGFAFLEPNVRGSTGYGRAYAHADDGADRIDAIRDVGAAVEWLGEHERVDSDRICVVGGSYGGYLALQAATRYPVAACVCVSGVVDLVSFLENTSEWRRPLREAEYGSLDTDSDLLERLSPADRIEELRCPVFFSHGENDSRVPIQAVRRLVERIEDQPVETLFFEDEGHNVVSRANRTTLYTRVAAFLEEHVV